MKHFAAYYRVSTKRQGESGLGLEAQRECVSRHVKAEGGKLVKEWTEVESGKRTRRQVDLTKPVLQLIAHRPQLVEAISYCLQTKARLIIAKLDRLARDVPFTSCLQASGIDFVACDLPNYNKLTGHIFAAMAEYEAEQIGNRTRAALAARKAKGLPVGGQIPACRNLDDAARKRGVKRRAELRRQEIDAAYLPILPLVARLRKSGKTLQQIADHLNAEGITTSTGKTWGKVQVMRLVERANRLGEKGN